MTPDDLINAVLTALGMSRGDLLHALLTTVALAPAISWLRPHVDPVLARWATSAKATATTADDNAVGFVTTVWRVLVWVPAAALRAIPIFATQAEVEELQKARREAKLLEDRR